VLGRDGRDQRGNFIGERVDLEGKFGHNLGADKNKENRSVNEKNI
jgi:hypothetical protein